MGCCGTANWKREEVPDHKFDFIDVRDYYTKAFMTRLRYCILFVFVFKSFAVYVADIYTAVTLLAFHHFNGSIYTRVEDDPTNNVKVPFVYGKWIFTGCIIFSFCLLAYEANKTRRIVRSRDISYAYTNVMANNYYSIRSYDHFCFFCQINNSKKKKDEFAFFIFFTFKGWKRLLVADGPRQVVNALVLYAVAKSTGWSTDINKYYEGNYFTAVMLLTMIFTVVVFAGSSVMLIIACVMYLPLVCYIKGNLKEYCCHKIDKRITELVQKKKKQRLGKYAAIARAEAAGDFSHLMNKKGIIVGQKMAQPTLPNLDIDALERESKRSNTQPHGSEKNLYRMGLGNDYGSSANLLANQGNGGGPAIYGHAGPGTNLSMTSSQDVHAGRPLGAQTPTGPPQMNDVLAQMGPIGTSPGLFAQRQVGRHNASSPAPSMNGEHLNTFGESQNFGYGYDGRQMNASASQRNLASVAGRSPLAPLDSRRANHGDERNDAYEMEPYNLSRSTSALGGHQVFPADAGNHSPAVDLSEYAPYTADDDMAGGATAPRSTSRNFLGIDQTMQNGSSGEAYEHSPDPRFQSRHQSFAFGDVYDAYLQDAAEDEESQAHATAFGAYGTPRNVANRQSFRGSRDSNGLPPFGHNGYANAHSHTMDGQASYGEQDEVGYALSPPNENVQFDGWNTHASKPDNDGGSMHSNRQPLQNGFYYQNMQPQHHQRQHSPQPDHQHNRPAYGDRQARDAHTTSHGLPNDEGSTQGGNSHYYRSGYSNTSWTTNGQPFGYDAARGSFGQR